MTTTDHAAEARRLVAIASTQHTQHSANNAQAIASAQVHATLALAAEQRTTNRLLTALIDQISEIGVHLPHSGAEHTRVRIRDYLPLEDWERLEGWNDDEEETTDGR